MLSAADNEMLVRTGPGTPMGALFRQFWIPVCLSAQVPEADGPQVRLKVLGEELLAFRATDGRIGLIERRCRHRGADLYYGRNEGGGVRCAFHGWKFDAEGRCVDAPTLDPEQFQRLDDKTGIRAYPTREWGDFVWAYLGPLPVPALPMMEFALVPPSHRHVSKKFQECNWAQAAEGAVDTAHFSFLHMPVTSSADDLPAKARQATRGYSANTMGTDHVRWMRDDSRPKFSIVRHDAGLALGGSRQAGDGRLYWRIAQYLMPAHAYTPSAVHGETYHGQSFIPIDDENCWVYVYSWNPVRPLTGEERADYASGGAIYPVMDAQYMPVRNRGNDYLLDRRRQKTENFTGIQGISEQDACIQDSQGRIADRTRELLGPTDAGITQFRRLMLDAARALQQSQRPPAATRPESYRVRAGGMVAPTTLSFEEVMVERFGHPVGLIDDGEAVRS
jgi:phenylpropionate dioxygenase-like ring-hydroxylating dioxygenase large terminal subunit